MAGKKPEDAIAAIVAQIKKIQERLDAGEGSAADKAKIEALEAKVEALESRLNESPDFGSWD